MHAALRLLPLLLFLPVLALADAAAVHHDIRVRLQPDEAMLEVRDTVRLPKGHAGTLEFALHPDLQPRLTGGGRLQALNSGGDSRPPELNVAPTVTAKRYRVELEPGRRQFTVNYTGSIRHALRDRGEEYARSFRETQGIIAPQGVFLAGASYWYPQLDQGLMTFDLRVQLPDGWYAMSQGERRSRAADTGEHWRCTTPQEEIYLIAGPFSEYRAEKDGIDAIVLLREADPSLARKYLDATHRYLELYSELIGPYPFPKFAMVENFWETGYGMPSFTLLGSKVIRFPFILHSSYPHEVLHNWWGNSVYVDYASGNWAEGLTSYLADHLIKEQQGRGVEYRRNLLQKYTDYVNHRDDFPLTQFRSRHSARTEAVGYGKTLMLFHMLRLQLGDETFIQGLRDFNAQYRFKVADWSALQRVYSDTARQPLDAFFAQWTTRTGAPQLRVVRAMASERPGGYLLTAILEQDQAGDPYALDIPLAVHLEGRRHAYQTRVHMTRKRQSLLIEVPARPLRLDIDPQFDLFRRLQRNEFPPAVSQAMGAQRVLVVLPGNARGTKGAYRALADSWQREKPDQVEITYDDALQALPHDRAVWLFGWDNRFRAGLNDALKPYDFTLADDSVRIGQTTLTPRQHSLVVLARHPRNPEQALGWLSASSASALPGLGRKLPHYGRYSYLAFSGDEPENILKGQWPVVNSPLSIDVLQSDNASFEIRPGTLAPRKPLVEARESFSVSRMQADMNVLADPAMAGRGLGTPQLDRAARYIAGQFQQAGLQPGGDDNGYFQAWTDTVGGGEVALQNVIGVLPGSDPELAGHSLVIGAHYDHLGRGERGGSARHRGRIHPGADDNASGLAVMLELARALQGKPLPRTLVFVAFTGEESERLGSRHYVRNPGAYPLDRTIAMLNLDTVGRLGDRPLVLFGTGSADEWVHIFRGAGYVTGVPVEPVADDFGSSDQSSFIEAGVPAVQFFGGLHDDIHTPGDTLDKVDPAGMMKVANVLSETVNYLAERAEPLSSRPGGERHIPRPPQRPQRRVTFGTVPDFTWQGEGVRLDDVRADTPAAAAGLRKGDIITAVNGAPVRDLREYSDALRRMSPGDEIRVRLLRGGNQLTVSAQVTQR